MAKEIVSNPVLRGRIKLLQKRLGTTEAAGLLVTNPRDIRYLTGFIGEDSWALLPTRSSRVYILSDFRFQEQIQREAPHARAIMRKKSLGDELAKLADRLKFGRIALQVEHVSLSQRKTLANKVGARRLLGIDDRLLQQRSVKDAGEIKAICRAISIQQRAFKQTLEFMEPGQSENEICAFLEYRMRTLGAAGTSFGSIVAADVNAALPHAIPGRKKIRRGGMVLLDWGAIYDGYCSDMTRVVFLGKPKAKLREIYQIVLDAQLGAIEAIGPGRRLAEVDAVARRVIEKAGYGKQFGHSLGHGIGLNIHEQPSLSPRSTGVLEPGQVVTVEPGIYLPGVGGVRIEDDVLVTARGNRGGRVLSDLPKTLQSAMI